MPADVEKQAQLQERLQCDCIGKYYAIRPGRYLLEVNIDKLIGVRVAQAQKIILIKNRITPANMRILRDSNARVRQLQKQTTEMAQVGQKTYSYAIYTNRYVRMIYRLLTGADAEIPIMVDPDAADAATNDGGV